MGPTETAISKIQSFIYSKDLCMKSRMLCIVFIVMVTLYDINTMVLLLFYKQSERVFLNFDFGEKKLH